MTGSPNALPRRSERSSEDHRRTLAEVWVMSGRMERAQAELAEKLAGSASGETEPRPTRAEPARPRRQK